MHTALATCTHARTSCRPMPEKFNRGYAAFHCEEIIAGRQLHSAIILIHGADKAQRLLRNDAGSVFRALRYGRRWIAPHDARVMCVMLDHSPFFDGKADSPSILIPGRRGWKQFAAHVRQLVLMPRWADGFTGAAEALDDLGYAIAESIAAMLCWGIEGDESIVAGQRDRAGASRPA